MRKTSQDRIGSSVTGEVRLRGGGGRTSMLLWRTSREFLKCIRHTRSGLLTCCGPDFREAGGSARGESSIIFSSALSRC